MHLQINKSYKCEVTWLDFSPFLGRVTIKEKRALSHQNQCHTVKGTLYLTNILANDQKSKPKSIPIMNAMTVQKET